MQKRALLNIDAAVGIVFEQVCVGWGRVWMGAGPDQPCARPEATVAARPLKRTVTILIRPTWRISSRLWVGRGSDVGGQDSMSGLGLYCARAGTVMLRNGFSSQFTSS